MAGITVHVERRAICERCSSVFDSHSIPAHQVGDRPRCPGVPKGARRSMVVFRREDNGEELLAVADDSPLDLARLVDL